MIMSMIENDKNNSDDDNNNNDNSDNDDNTSNDNSDSDGNNDDDNHNSMLPVDSPHKGRIMLNFDVTFVESKNISRVSGDLRRQVTSL